jgi:2-keto-4-pentenoate hydratase
MKQDEIAEAAQLLAQARRTASRVTELPVQPESVTEAHAIQDAVAARLSESVGAFKANAPPNEEPTRGLIYARTIRPSPARVPVSEAADCGVEGEVAFRFALDLPPRADPYTRDEVAGAMDACAAIEVISSRFQDHAARSALEKLADCVSNAGFVPGAPVRDWGKLNFGAIHVTLSVNGQAVLDQSGGHPTGDPLGVAVELVNMMRTGAGVRAGQFVTCGSCTGLRFLKPGDACLVRFDGLGSAEATFEAARSHP